MSRCFQYRWEIRQGKALFSFGRLDLLGGKRFFCIVWVVKRLIVYGDGADVLKHLEWLHKIFRLPNRDVFCLAA